MTVRPGFGGQKYIQTMESKIAQVRKMISDANLDDKVNVEVDGGISVDTVGGAAKSGANVLVAGSALFKDPKGLTNAVQQIRETATKAFNSR
jgi:ribulose-phosphate 3-epimerase